MPGLRNPVQDNEHKGHCEAKLHLRIGLEGDGSGGVRTVTEVRKPIWETSAVLRPDAIKI